MSLNMMSYKCVQNHTVLLVPDLFAAYNRSCCIHSDVFAQLYGPATSLSQFERPGPVIKVYRLSG